MLKHVLNQRATEPGIDNTRMLLANFLVQILIEARCVTWEINNTEFIPVKTQQRLEESM
jgi:hypothetical protein